ncbi:MAG: prephenate dehydratase [Candidatus Syntropharchaeia archaeon]
MKIGILGPEGTFSEKAAEKWIKSGRSGEIRYYDDIFDVVQALMEKEIDQGIIPIENSLEGSVGITLDILREFDVNIIGEVSVQVKINLLSKGNLSDIRVILSHPQALAQCRRFIRKNFRNVEIRTTGSTAHAAKLAEEFEEMAALASEESAEKYNLKVLCENVQDQESVTRFIVLGREKTKPTGRDKTSLLIYLSDRPGALYEVLGEFARRGINLTKIESRPSKKALGDYMFHIDCEGHFEEERIREALLAIEKKVEMLKVLGSYPMG